jgi:2-polyprenyl-3-methyl-5-hydroxy-6-metoxy-1,4-benzoquinol methylase
MYGLPDRFMFLFIFDFLSIAERKNPWGLVEAFARAFSPADEPILVIKCINGDKRLKDLERLRSRVADMSNVLLLEDYFSKEQKNGLLAVCDCYASLHRSEGTGITLAEAMALGKPVIGTAYSGTLEFMTNRNSYLVDYVKTTVPAGCEPYPRDYVWADPLLDQAAEQMRRVFEDRKEAARRGAQAREDIRSKHSPAVCGAKLAARLADIRRDRPRRAARQSPLTNSAMSSSSLPPGELLHQARALLTPRADLPAHARLRSVRVGAQRLLLRALRPYWWGQRQLADRLITALHRVEETRTAEESTWRARLDGIDSQLATLTASVAATRRLDQVESQVATVGASVAAVEAQVATIGRSVSGFQTSATAHLGALTGGVTQLEKQMEDLLNRLYPVPYMNNPAELSYLDEGGRKRLGFRSAGSPREGYLGFEDIFRGSEPFIRDRFRAYLPFLENEPIVDVGCGRGELLELVRELGRAGIGVDVDEEMVRRCVAKGLNATHAEGVAFLLAQDDSSLGVVFSSQVIEHLDHAAINAFFDAAFAKLKPGGLLIVETVNPHSLEALKGFWVDLTHRAPIFPEVALALCLLRRFDTAFVLFPNGTGDFEADRRTQGEYAVIARTRPL